MAPFHFAIVAAVPLVALVLARAGRRSARADRAVRSGFAAVLAANELAWYAYVLGRGWVDPPFGLPLDLCDVVVWGTIAALVWELPRVREVLYYLALAGTGMAVLTPDIAPEASPYVLGRYFLAHGGIVAAILYLVFTHALRPGPGSWWRALLWVSGYALVIGTFNLAFGTNYFYLRRKPAAGSLLDFFGPWPWYVVAGAVLAAALFYVLSLPFRAGADPVRVHGRTPSHRTGGTP